MGKGFSMKSKLESNLCFESVDYNRHFKADQTIWHRNYVNTIWPSWNATVYSSAHYAYGNPAHTKNGSYSLILITTPYNRYLPTHNNPSCNLRLGQWFKETHKQRIHHVLPPHSVRPASVHLRRDRDSFSK